MKKDIHYSEVRLKSGLNRIENSSMSERQKTKIKRLVHELQIGKASSKKVGSHRISSYLQFLERMHDYFKKDIDKVTEKQAEQFYLDLENDKIRQKNGEPYKDTTKNEYVKTFKRYLGWLFKTKSNNNKKYVKIAGWIKEYKSKPNKKAITLKEAEAVVSKCEALRDKVLFIFLFDSGARIEETLNLKFKDIEVHKSKKGEEYYLVDIRYSKTLPRRIAIPIASKYLTEWVKTMAKDEEDYIFDLTYANSRRIIAYMSQNALGYKITPHELRHSSATYYATKTGRSNLFKFYHRFGWKFGSKEANTYIDRNLLEGEEQEEVIQTVNRDRITELEDELADLTQKFNKFTMIKDQMLEKPDGDWTAIWVKNTE